MFLRLTTLSLLVLFPIAWTAPLLRASFLPFLGGQNISVLSGLRALWSSDPALAILVGALALVLPYLKTVTQALILFGRLPVRFAPALHELARWAMADVFLLALYLVVVKGVGLGRVETAWGLYLFTACVLASLLIARRLGAAPPARRE